MENHYALIVAILKGCTPEQAFERLNTGHNKTIKAKETEILEMIKLKSEGLTYKEIGEMYGLSDHATYRKIKRYNEKQNQGGVLSE